MHVKFYDDPSDSANCPRRLMALVNSANIDAAEAGAKFTDALLWMQMNARPYGTLLPISAHQGLVPQGVLYYHENHGYRLYFSELHQRGNGRTLEIRALLVAFPGDAEPACIADCHRRHAAIV